MSACLVLVRVLCLMLTVSMSRCDSEPEPSDPGQVYKIEGKILPPDTPPPDWHSVTTVTIDGGERRSFLKEDNSFVFQVLFPRLVHHFHVLFDYYRALRRGATW